MSDTQVMPDVNVGGAKADIPIYSDLAGAVNAWGDGHVNLGDLMGGADAALGILGAALDPEGAVIGAVVGWLMNIIVEHCGPLKQALDDLLGDPDAVSGVAGKWILAGQLIDEVHTAHQQYANDIPGWTGTAADAYRGVLGGELGLYEQARGSAAGMAGWINIAGGVVATFRGMVWDAIRDFLTQAIEAAIAAVASSWFTLGGSIGVFTGWFVGKVSSLAAKLSHHLAKLLRKLAALARKLHLSGRKFDEAAEKLGQAATRLSRTARRHYRMSVRPDPTMHVPWNRDGTFWDTHPGLARTKENYDKYQGGAEAVNDQVEAHQKTHDDPTFKTDPSSDDPRRGDWVV